MRCSRLAPFFVVAALAGPARAFDDPSQFFTISGIPHQATISASAEGIYFTGAPRFARQTCASCHTGGPGLLEVKLGAEPVSLFSTGYVPGTPYRFEVELLSESAGFEWNGPATCTEAPGRNDRYAYVQCNNNSFVLEADVGDAPLQRVKDDRGNIVYEPFCAASPKGGVCPAPLPTDQSLVAPDGDAVFANRGLSTDPAMPKLVLRNDPTHWDVWWTAPGPGSGPVTLYLALVDGNGGTGRPDDDQDPYGDDTVSASIVIKEAGSPTPAGATAGCAAAPLAAWPLGPLPLLVLGIAWLLARMLARARRRLR